MIIKNNKTGAMYSSNTLEKTEYGFRDDENYIDDNCGGYTTLYFENDDWSEY